MMLYPLATQLDIKCSIEVFLGQFHYIYWLMIASVSVEMDILDGK